MAAWAIEDKSRMQGILSISPLRSTSTIEQQYLQAMLHANKYRSNLEYEKEKMMEDNYKELGVDPNMVRFSDNGDATSHYQTGTWRVRRNR